MRGRKFITHTALNGQPYFTFNASNGQVLMTSETYSSVQQMQDTLDTLVGKTMPIKVQNELILKKNEK